MTKDEALQEVAALSKGITHDAAQLLELLGTGAVQLPIKGTDQYVVAGTLATITSVLGSAVSTAVGEPVATADDQWIFDLAAEHEARGNGLYGPVTFDATGLVNFAQAVAARLAAPTQAKPVDLSGLTRYAPTMSNEALFTMYRKADGDYVKLADVERLFAAPTQVSAPQAEWAILMLRAAIEAQLDPKWECNSDHPALAHALRVTAHVVTEVAPQASAAQEVRAVPEAERDLCTALLACPHTMDENRVVLYRNATKDGNAYAQIADRLKAAFVKLTAPTSTSTAPDAMDEGKWVSVDERLPDDDCRVLAATWFTMTHGQHLDIVSFRRGTGKFSHSDVTHWMPLPTVPASQPSLDEVTGAGKGEVA